jgi:hypothetical protein
LFVYWKNTSSKSEKVVGLEGGPLPITVLLIETLVVLLHYLLIICISLLYLERWLSLEILRLRYHWLYYVLVLHLLVVLMNLTSKFRVLTHLILLVMTANLIQIIEALHRRWLQKLVALSNQWWTLHLTVVSRVLR